MNIAPISIDDAVELLEDDAVTVIDVRRDDEVAQGRLAGALHLDVEAADFTERLGELDRDGRYALYCRSGNRSGLAAARLRAAGIADATNIGGFADLVAAGARTER